MFYFFLAIFDRLGSVFSRPSLYSVSYFSVCPKSPSYMSVVYCRIVEDELKMLHFTILTRGNGMIMLAFGRKSGCDIT